jgi:nucleotidyltransferase substrate binding protein (TIGR01987 family)
MADPPARIDLAPLARALAMLDEAIAFWRAEPAGSRLKPHLRSAVIQSFEFSYELALRLLRRTLVERAASTAAVADLSFNDLLRAAADAGLLPDALGWRGWRELRNITPRAYDEPRAEAVAGQAEAFAADARALLARLEAAGHG